MSSDKQQLSSEGRPQRRRFPVLSHWRNDRLVYERAPGSAQPTIKDVELSPGAAKPPAEGILAALKNRRPAARSVLGLLGVGAAATSSPRAPASPASAVSATASPGSAGAGSASPASTAPSLAASPSASPAVSPAAQEQGAARPSRGAPPASPRGATPAGPRPAIRCQSALAAARGKAAAARPAPASRRSRSVSFAGEPAVTSIESFSHLSDALWYAGFAVECDRCDQPVRWGAEGSLTGAPGRSRFSQWQVLRGNRSTGFLDYILP